jgi:anti-sigma regulatory factor (Ser/Thr protein kinase)
MLEQRRQFPGTAVQISAMRDFVREGCNAAWRDISDAEAVAQLTLAVSEVASNIVLHGLQGGPDLQIELQLTIDDQQACVTFLYPGCAFDPSSSQAPHLNGQAESGYGLYLIKQSVDGFHFSRDDAGICAIRLHKDRR